ncbi:MAG TPA: AAA family ATPase [Candidatus Saccharimonadales bacterium]|nr:AAA family ATPase [Candidatus Saccharimonadales bacterium]
MKITKVTLQNFRAFNEPFELDLDGGKNLLLHGENGSGKSSIFLGLRRFFEELGDDIAKYKNRFANPTRESHVRLHIKGPDATNVLYDNDVWWDDKDAHPLTIPKSPATKPISKELRSILVDSARRAGFLDYRVLLRTNLFTGVLSRYHTGDPIHSVIYGTDSKGLEAQLFDVVTLAIVAGVRTTISGGTETTLGTLIRKVWEKRPQYFYKWMRDEANEVANTFNTAFNAKLPELEVKMAEFLDNFENHQLTIRFRPVTLAWDQDTRSLTGAELIPDISFRGVPVSDYHQLLNEARLSAVATCMFLAGVHLSDNDYANPAYPRFLFLDDTLLGLELQNRLPVLRILTSDAFKHYQIFLFTHDRVWFDLACGYLTEKAGWVHKELLADEDTGHLIPRLRSSEADLERARKHLANGDLKAAAVYARSAFEWKLRIVCEKNGIKLPFKPDADKVGAGVLWDGIMARQREREEQRKRGSQVPDFVPSALEGAVEIMRSTVLNKLSHSGASGLVPSEVATAIATVGNVFSHSFPKVAGP